jgi:calcium-dependent protein kinase
MRNMFLQLDTDGNGSLSRDELIRGAEKLRVTVEEIDTILEECDVDGDGCVNYSEFITAATN